MAETTINRYHDHAVLKPVLTRQDAIEAMVKDADGRIKVKASGGIRNYEQAKRFVDMGCERPGKGFGSTPIICEGTGESLEEDY